MLDTERYRAQADECERQSEHATTQAERDAYKKIADEWRKLAAAAEVGRYQKWGG
jgi:hypothetical protein